MFRAAMLGKISSRSIFSYVFASARLVQPCQIRAITRCYDGRARPPGAPIHDSITSMSKSKAKLLSHAHYLITAIDINHLTGYCCGGVTCKKHSGGAQFDRITTAFQRRAFLVMLQHRRESADATGGQRLDRSSRNAVYTDFFRAEVVGR